MRKADEVRMYALRGDLRNIGHNSARKAVKLRVYKLPQDNLRYRREHADNAARAVTLIVEHFPSLKCEIPVSKSDTGSFLFAVING